ncbi:MAG: phenylacetyl-CoA:acceptor oxidoreductase [Chloroflexi bacterium]|nr:phenylacetyl-CoA:acceptor oxidoreductase [Chloroflexota bacterium]
MREKPAHQTPWDWRAGIQFSCGGTGTGLLLFTAVASFQNPAWLTYTGWLSLLIIAIGLASVWIKLGQRWRAMYVILNPRTSWMSREAFLSLPLMGLGLAAMIWQSPLLALAAALFGLGFLFAQAKMLNTSMGIPVWREPLLVPVIVLTGLVEGAGLLLAITPVLSGAEVAVFGDIGIWLPITLFFLLLLRLWVWHSYRSKLTQPGAAPLAAAAALNRINKMLMGVGHLLPLLALLIIPILPIGSMLATTVTFIIAGLTALGGGWQMKFTIITRAAYNQGFALTHTPARTPGYGGDGTKPGW